MRRLGFYPGKVLALEQIQKLQKLPLEDVAGYVSREVAASRGVRDDAFPYIKVRATPLHFVEACNSYISFLTQSVWSGSTFDY